jgi:hypothetical protein
MDLKIIKVKADKLFPDSPEMYKIKKIYFCVLNYIHKNDWTGACHASSSVMYLLLREQGIDAKLYIGEVKRDDIIFDHSWLEINGQIFDAAISNTQIKNIQFPAVFSNIELSTGNSTLSDYSFKSGQGLESEMEFFSSNTLGYYLDNFPNHPKGLWGIASILSKQMGMKFNIAKAKNMYSNENWLQKS